MTLDWSPLAIATVVLAAVAVWSILQTRSIHKEELRVRETERELDFKLRLLDEVRDWARDCLRFGFLQSRAGEKTEYEKRQLHEMHEGLVGAADVTRFAGAVFRGELKKQLVRTVGYLKSIEHTSQQIPDEYVKAFGDLIKIVDRLKWNLLKTHSR